MNYPGAELRGIKQLTSLSLRDISPFRGDKKLRQCKSPLTGGTRRSRGGSYITDYPNASIEEFF